MSKSREPKTVAHWSVNARFDLLVVGVVLGISMVAGAALVATHSHTFEPPSPDSLILKPIAKLGPGAGKEISGIVKSRTQEGIYWTLNDSGDEPRIYPIRIDGSVVPSARYPDVPGTLVAGALNSDWEDVAVDASHRLIIADFGNNSNARRDLTLYLCEEPEATDGRISLTRTILFRYPDQESIPAKRDNRNFDAEGIFTVGDDIYILTKHRSDTKTKLYRVDDREFGVVNVVTYLGEYELSGQATGADASADGLKLAILTYDSVWLFERTHLQQPFFAGRVSKRDYHMEDGRSDSESICFEDANTLLIADESRGMLYRLPLAELKEARPAAPTLQGNPEHDCRVMSFNIRFAGGDKGPNAWPKRRDAVATTIAANAPDLLGMQEVEAEQADWLQSIMPEYSFHGVGRADGKRQGEFSPIMFRKDRFQLLASGHFWLSETPDRPGSKGWDGACERMASWIRVRDLRTQGTLLIMNTHLDHVGQVAREKGLALVMQRAYELANGAGVIVMGDFNMTPENPIAAAWIGETEKNLTSNSEPKAPQSDSPSASTQHESKVTLRDTYRVLHPQQGRDEVTFNGWKPTFLGSRIDWIAATPNFQVVTASIDRRMPKGIIPSDHYPVISVIRDAPKK